METMTRYRKIYILQAGFDFTPLKGMADEVEFVTSGFETYDRVLEFCDRKMEDFDPDLDAIIVVGRSITMFLIGLYLGTKFPGKELTIGIYKSKISDHKKYEWRGFKV